MFNNRNESRYFRNESCQLLISSGTVCKPCLDLQNQELKCFEKKKAKFTTPVHKKAPVSALSSARIVSTLQKQRSDNLKLREENIKLKCEVQELKELINKQAVKVDETLHQDLQSIFQSIDKRKVNPFLKLFWEEQIKYIQEHPSQVRYHPMIIKFCLALHAKSPSAYKHMRHDEKLGCGALILLSQRTLRDYRNYIRPNTGFDADVINELTTKTNDFPYIQRFVVLSFDEMKIQQDLVWNKHTGELIGFVDLGDGDLNLAVLKNVDDLATHILVFLVKSITNPLSYSFATFATKGVSSFQIYPLFWRAVFLLEMHCRLFVVAATSDGASSNRSFYKIHKGFVEGDDSVVYRTPNISCDDERFIFFFSDIPYLLKTLRNSLSSSGSSKCRFMWNGGFHILWKHITDFYDDDSDSSLRLLPKLTPDHVYLNSYSVMIIIAAQVLSETVGNVLLNFGPQEAAGTARFCLLVDKFFDCGNVRNTQEWHIKNKKFLKPYTSVDDERFVWLREVFLKYFEDWQASIEHEYPTLSTEMKAKMFIAKPTYEGVQMSVHSLIDLVKFMLSKGYSLFILSFFNL